MSAAADEFVADSPRDALDRILPELRKKADLIILLAHVGDKETRELLANLPADHGIDIVIEGHDYRQHRAPIWVNGALMLAANNQGKFVGQADLLVSPAGVVQKDAAAVSIHELGKGSDEVASMAKKVEAFKKEIEVLRAQKISFAHDRPEGTDSARFLGQTTCGRCHSQYLNAEMRGPHSRAFQSLSSKGQDGNSDCVGCHVTGFWHANGYDQVPDPRVAGRDLLRNVQCEACHGYGSEHDRRGDWVSRARESCTTCHDQQNDPDFEFAREWAKIAHPKMESAER